ncbi:sigma-70 family RNA polymerase sigma factor [Gordonia soli]|uniref:Putative RNA polymerase ECF-type sigma factor n=1 Tax=Gordonia soli NBRC 108243 TaxID=1223545 RepID=M0QEG5_9ACTN|nr:sigma-70 family RNA polymerase sigma factor [Gordonia soli]GAC66983.1 putative RNA polymerase ECF-type sigma factor [Gordonia soli NBRC 108243]
MTDDNLTSEFEAQRDHLRSVAFRMLGSHADAEDAVQETWLRASASGSADVDNVAGWLTTITSRICLNILRSRRAHPTDSLDVDERPEPVILPLQESVDPEPQALLADSVSVALLVVLESLGPDERLAFVLHDLFALPFDEIAAIVGKSSAATRKLASRARTRVQDSSPTRGIELGEQRRVVEAFISAARGGDLEQLMQVLDPDIVLRTDGLLRPVVGAAKVGRRAAQFQRLVERTLMVRIDDRIGVLAFTGDAVSSIATFSVTGGRVTAMDIIADAERIAALDLTAVLD